MKAVKTILIWGAIIILGALIVLPIFISPIVKTAVEKIGPAVTGVPITLEGVSLSLLSGKANIKGLVVGNPEGFKSDSAIKLREFNAELDLTSLLSDKIIVRDVTIDGPEITYETRLTSSNISTILKNLESKGGEKAPARDEKKESAAPAKKIQLDHFLFKDGRVMLASSQMGGKGLVLPLPTIELRDIGKEGDGTSIADMLKRIFAEINKTVARTIANPDQVLGKGKEVLEGAAGGLKDKGSEMASKSKENLEGAAGDLADAGGEAVNKLKGSASKLVGGILGGKE